MCGDTFLVKFMGFLLNVIENWHGKCSYKKNRVHFFYMDFFVVDGSFIKIYVVCTGTSAVYLVILMRFFSFFHIWCTSVPNRSQEQTNGSRV